MCNLCGTCKFGCNSNLMCNSENKSRCISKGHQSSVLYLNSRSTNSKDNYIFLDARNFHWLNTSCVKLHRQKKSHPFLLCITWYIYSLKEKYSLTHSWSLLVRGPTKQQILSTLKQEPPVVETRYFLFQRPHCFSIATTTHPQGYGFKI
jgi:hypothetical protein